MGETRDERRERQKRISKVTLPSLGELADTLEELVSDVFDQPIPFERRNGADVMALSFVTKQHEHLRSVRLLISAGLHRDALLIARTMIEGHGRLLWAFSRSPERTDRWFWYSAILDWRQILKNEKAGLIVDAGVRAVVKEDVEIHGPKYYEKKARSKLEVAERSKTVADLPDDPWENDWTPTNLREMFKELNLEDLYELGYRRSSEWVHWGPRAINMAMQSTERGVEGFTQEDWRGAAIAMQLGCVSLLHSLEELDRHFSLGTTERIGELRETFRTISDEWLVIDD